MYVNKKKQNIEYKIVIIKTKKNEKIENKREKK